MKFNYYLKDIQVNNKNTYATILYKGYYFMGEAILHEHDFDKYSYIFGGTLAEMRAVLNAVTAELEWTSADLKTKENFLKAAQDCKNFDKNCASIKTLYHFINLDKKKVASLKSLKKQMKAEIKNVIDMQEEKNKRVEKILEKKKNVEE